MEVSHFDDGISKELEISPNAINNSKLNLFSSFIKNFLNKEISNNFVIGFGRVGLNLKCYKCSNCFFGCEDNYISNARDYLRKLIDEKKIEYRDNLYLKRFINKNGLIELEFESQRNSKILTKKLFIGA